MINIYKLDVKIQDVNRIKGEIKKRREERTRQQGKKLLGNVLYSIRNKFFSTLNFQFELK